VKKQIERIKILPHILTLAEACEVLCCHPNTLRNWDNKGTLKAIRFGTRKDRRYKRDDVLKIINNVDVV
jgi:excisionase family DNA binding protein